MLKTGFCLLLCFCCGLHAQSQSADNKYTNLFEYGEPLTSSEVNFKNLFNNFPKLVKNANELDLLSYKCVGVIKNRRQARKFLKKNLYPNAPGWDVFRIGDEVSPVFSKTIGENKSELNEIIKTISEKYVHPGYEVYEVEYVCEMRAHKNYVFVNPETKQVVTKGNIFAFDIPIPK